MDNVLRFLNFEREFQICLIPSAWIFFSLNTPPPPPVYVVDKFRDRSFKFNRFKRYLLRYFNSLS